MKHAFFLIIAIQFIFLQKINAQQNTTISAEINLIQSTRNSTKQQTLVALSFTNNSNEDIFIGDVLTYLTGRRNGLFNIYKDGVYYKALTDDYFSGFFTGHDQPATNVMGLLYNNYVTDSITSKNMYANDSIVKKYLQKTNQDGKGGRFDFLSHSLFLKAHETYKYYFICPIEEILKDNGNYRIKYEPKLNIENPSLKNIDKVLSYHRIFPDKIDCNTLSIKIIPSN